MGSSYQGIDGPMAPRTRMDSSTEARVWSPKTAMRIAVPAARNGMVCISGAATPPPRALWRSTTMRTSTGRPASSAATAIRPVGPQLSDSVATTTPMAAGNRRRVRMARSMNTHVSRAPRATTGSGRRPLLYGSQNASRTPAADQ